MTHLFDPPCLQDEAAYSAALDELEDLMLAEPGSPAGHRFDELAALIKDYEACRYSSESVSRARFSSTRRDSLS
jgi:antitoxin component HigA of HigAB toxin-antitoxin module